MKRAFSPLARLSFAALTVLGGLALAGSPALADDETTPSPNPDAGLTTQVPSEKDLPTYDLLDAARKGLVSVSAEGTGDGRMTVSVHNRTKKQLRVVLPPGLIASGASGQMGGMGGMGGGGRGGGMAGTGGGVG